VQAIARSAENLAHRDEFTMDDNQIVKMSDESAWKAGTEKRVMLK
jgi:hypothetical protein